MSRWHVWGDYVHNRPERIGEAKLERSDTAGPRRSAAAAGFDLERRTRNGFESWAAEYAAQGDEERVELEFASYPTVRGWMRR